MDWSHTHAPSDPPLLSGHIRTLPLSCSLICAPHFPSILPFTLVLREKKVTRHLMTLSWKREEGMFV